jgi:uncharacterized protein involved in type VI secretion and phage assembly
MRAGAERPWTNDGILCGVYYALVCQNKDDEKKLARIKVKFPWLDEGMKDQAHWAQLATPMSGDKFGWYTLPEVEDMVAVVFIAGDIRQPVVLGGIWNKTDTPPEPITDGKNEFRGYKSRSGHRFLLDDSSKVKVSIADKTDMLQLSIGQFDDGGGGPNKHKIARPKNGGTSGVAAVSMSGKFQILCPDGTLKIEGGDKIVVSAGDKMDINVTGKLTLDGGPKAELNTSSNGKYEGATTDII